MPENDWNAYRELFLHELKENGKQFNHIASALDAMNTEITLIKVEIGQLKVKAAMIGGAAGVVVTSIVSLVIKLWS